VFVRRHRNSIGRAANQDAQGSCVVGNVVRHGMCVIWIIDAVVRICATIQHHVSLSFQMLSDSGLQSRSRMIASNANSHATKIPTTDVDEPVSIAEELFLDS